MSGANDNDWRREFGLEHAGTDAFFSSKAELNASTAHVSQRHVLRRAFDLLRLDGVLCTESTPLVYFKQVKRIEPAEVARLHRTFWNHGGAPILALVSSTEVHVYSGLVPPVPDVGADGRIPSFVETLSRASSALQEFLPAVESGEFFRRHQPSFDPSQRVDRRLLDNLEATRQQLLATGDVDPAILDALLCRLVFACYLFDRGVVKASYLEGLGVPGAGHLRDVLALQPRSKAKRHLYDLFKQLGKDFNGDLFSDDLDAESRAVPVAHLDPLNEFFRATDVETGQTAFWPYDFGVIPIETISAIYERFLRVTDREEGAFYTPRFLAELVLDLALAPVPSLLGRRYLDPACGSGIFLVGLFNRIAEEWKQANPNVKNDRRARELREILCSSLCGVDINPTACRITAFSLYLAYLDQLSPRDIEELQEKGHKLPRLIHYQGNHVPVEGNIWCNDFFAEDVTCPADAAVVVGNPPWSSSATSDTPAGQWCAERGYPVPDKQMAVAFAWKAGQHARDDGQVCLLLPHGVLFNHSRAAKDFQRTFFTRHAVDQVLNLADYQRFLFDEAGHPAIVMTYRRGAPEGPQHLIQYWAPKADWLVTRADVITLTPDDRSVIRLHEVLSDLEGADAPQIWKQRYWATARDWRLIDRLSMYPRLRDRVRGAQDGEGGKPWTMGEGFQPLGENDDSSTAKAVRLPSKLFIEATSPCINLFLRSRECTMLPTAQVIVRGRSNTSTAAFRAPHVLVSQGFSRVAFADFDVSFRHALRGISGPGEDRELLIFLAAYLCTPLAQYFAFHTSSNWGVSRKKVHVEELLRLPFPTPDVLPSPSRAKRIVSEVASIVTEAMAGTGELLVDRSDVVRTAMRSIVPLVDEYFDLMRAEKSLIEDTVRVIIPSVRPTRHRPVVPTIEPSTPEQRRRYTDSLCTTLSGWATNGAIVHGRALASSRLGIGVAILQKTREGVAIAESQERDGDVLQVLDHLRRSAAVKINTLELIRGAKVFVGDRLYIVKPIGQRFWTETAALNHADEIAGTLLMHIPAEVAW